MGGGGTKDGRKNITILGENKKSDGEGQSLQTKNGASKKSSTIGVHP